MSRKKNSETIGNSFDIIYDKNNVANNIKDNVNSEIEWVEDEFGRRVDDGDPGPFALTEVKSFSALMKRNARRNFKLKGFDFDVDTFENLIDAFVEKDMIPVLLRCDHTDLDEFCLKVYRTDYNTAYKILLGFADMWMRKSVKNLANSGNATALGIASKHFMKLSDEAEKNAINITINNDYKIDEEDK